MKRGGAIGAIGIFGVGSPFGDDRIGWEAVAAMRRAGFAQRYSLRKLETCDRPGTHLLALMDGLDYAFVIDAMQSGAAPGVMRRLDAAEIETAPSIVSTHGFGLAYTLSLGSTLGTLPQRLVLYGVEIADAEPREKLTAEVEQAIAPLLQALADEISATANRSVRHAHDGFGFP